MKEKAKLKAIELIEKFENETHSLVKDDLAKKCALIAVEEILEGSNIWNLVEGKSRVFWNEVKNQLNDM